MPNIISKILTAGADKEIKAFSARVGEINYLEDEIQPLSDEELRAKTAEFRERHDRGESLDELLPEAFAVVREASVRTTGLRHFDVQLIGGMVLHKGQIAEMKTGEGKTLVSTLAGYLNAIPKTGVHIVTVNDYLAKRDSEWMGQIYNFLGMEAGLIQNGMKTPGRKKAYASDVTYGTNSEFGFDYLRDNMVSKPTSRVQNGHAYAIVDEVDSILIDEARTPLIISGASTQSSGTYRAFAKAVRGLKRDVDFVMDEGKRTISATESGLARVEQLVGVEDLYADMSGQLSNHLQQALKAQFLFHRDVDYLVTDGEVKIVDEFTGRVMEGRRYSEGLHQAIEAKENVRVRDENQTMATVTLQNYFRLYDKLSGMTGTAKTEDAEFRDIYKLDVEVIPPNKPVVREELPDLVYRTIDAKFDAVARDVAERHANQQPCLVGTVSIESSERLSAALTKQGISHNVLNAKHHAEEAAIVAQAGRAGAVTIATNMAGRGTDILLGGNPENMAADIIVQKGIDPDEATEEELRAAREEAEGICEREAEIVRDAGGLAVIGTERHESRRIDNQLRGRSGRQGDPGSAQFYLSLEDDLMRLFGGDRMEKISAMMERTELEDDMPIQAKMVTKGIESAQRQVESMHFSARKHVLEYDDVMDKQRKTIYAERDAILAGKSYGDRIEELIADIARDAVQEHCPSHEPFEEWDIDGLDAWYAALTGTRSTNDGDAGEDGASGEADDGTGDGKAGPVHFAKLDHHETTAGMTDVVTHEVMRAYEAKKEGMPPEVFEEVQNQVMLRVIDTRWMAHLSEMDYLRAGIGLRAVGQRDPLVEYKEEAFRMFGDLVSQIYEDFLHTLLRLEVRQKPAEGDASGQDGASGEGGASGQGGGSEGGAAGGAGGIARGQLGAAADDEQTLSSVSYSAPDGNAAVSAAARTASAAADSAGSVPKVSQGKTRTVVKDKDDPYANVGRNDPCPCGSGKKFKKCHGANR